MDTEAKALARAIRATGALKFGSFTLKGGARSTYYLDLRVLNTTEHVRTAAGVLLGLAAEFEPYAALAGPAVGAVPLVGACLALTGLPTRGGWVLAAAKDHGREAAVQGSVLPGDRVVALEDVTTTGGSLAGAVLALRAHGCEVIGAICLVNRGGRRPVTALAELGVPFKAALTPADLNIEEDRE